MEPCFPSMKYYGVSAPSAASSHHFPPQQYAQAPPPLRPPSPLRYGLSSASYPTAQAQPYSQQPQLQLHPPPAPPPPLPRFSSNMAPFSSVPLDHPFGGAAPSAMRFNSMVANPSAFQLPPVSSGAPMGTPIPSSSLSSLSAATSQLQFASALSQLDPIQLSNLTALAFPSQFPSAAPEVEVVKKRKKDPDAPKHPLSAYLFYVAEQRPILAKTHSSLSFTEVARIIGRRWKSMTKQQRTAYDKKAEADKQRYEGEKVEYIKNKKRALQELEDLKEAAPEGSPALPEDDIDSLSADLEYC